MSAEDNCQYGTKYYREILPDSALTQLETTRENCAAVSSGNNAIQRPTMVYARRFIRKMRGGAQAHLIEGHDGNCYVAKFINNPQHRRVLINEWMAAQLMQYLGIKTPQTALVNVSAEFLSDNPEVYLQGKARIAVNPGIHFGSRHPGHPHTTRVHDVLPDTFLARVTNRADFIGALAFDHWVCNADKPQAIFTPHTNVQNEAGGTRFEAFMIDRGFAFGGVDWLLRESPLTGIHHQAGFYDGLRGISDCEPWLSCIEAVQEKLLYDVVDTIPRCWKDTIADSGLDRLIRGLLNGRSRVADSIIASANNGHRPFRNWTNSTDSERHQLQREKCSEERALTRAFGSPETIERELIVRKLESVSSNSANSAAPPIVAPRSMNMPTLPITISADSPPKTSLMSSRTPVSR